jgi:uncharacterized protein YyaL (SSP411 family)
MSGGEASGRANRLEDETSPYLLQHAHDPVDWYPWGPEALARARELDRPLFLSIGYAACHWCHVMAHESFRDPVTAAALAADFVAIKVDREERPDIDAIYMDAVQALTGSGGWPLSVFATPDGRPFYGGTYYPPVSRHGMPAFRDVLASIAEAWRDRRDDVERAAAGLTDALADAVRARAPAVSPGAGTLARAVAEMTAGADPVRGGWGSAPRFPQPMAIEVLLRRSAGGADDEALAVARHALAGMAAGGIRDHLGGGFARYSTDAAWLVPHFEKMLYDNAQLARAYLHAWQATRDTRLLEVATQTLDFMARDLALPDGLFAASLDADTEGVEGATYVWATDEVDAILGAADAAMTDPAVGTGRGADDDGAVRAGEPPLSLVFREAYGVTPAGNWEGSTILSRVRDDDVLADRFGVPPSTIRAQLAAARAALLATRDRRPQPARDDKAIAAWNGLAIAAFADAARALAVTVTRAPGEAAAVSGTDEGTGRAALAAGYRAVAERAGEAALRLLVGADGRLRRSWKDGRSTATAVLEDEADLAEGFLALYEATFDERWFLAAVARADTILAHFADPAGGFFDTADDAEALVIRPASLQDNALPSGGAMAAVALLRLAACTGEAAYAAAADGAIDRVGALLDRHPMAFAWWLVALDLRATGIAEVAIVGDADDAETVALLAVANSGYRPRQVVTGTADPQASVLPLLQARFALDGHPTAFVCRDFACRQPVTEPAALAALLAAGG